MNKTRHRASEPFAPRPGDRIADRLHLVAAWATRVAAILNVDGAPFAAAEIAALAREQERDEQQLLERFQAFREFYAHYNETLRAREPVLFAGIAEMERRRGEPETRRAMRFCKLRRPPLAKVRAAVEETLRASGE